MAITATMAEAQNDYYKAMRAGKREGETLPNLDDILKEKNITQKQQYRCPGGSSWTGSDPF